MKEVLKAISKHTTDRYVEVKDGVFYYVTTGKLIPDHCIKKTLYHEECPDGFYTLYKYTCGDKHPCRIGKPWKKCIARKIAIPSKCGKYVLGKIGNVIISPQSVANIIKEVTSNGWFIASNKQA